MITPRRNGEVDDLRMRVEARKEGTADAKSTGTGDGLSDGNLEKTEPSAREESMTYWYERTEFSFSGALSSP